MYMVYVGVAHEHADSGILKHMYMYVLHNVIFTQCEALFQKSYDHACPPTHIKSDCVLLPILILDLEDLHVRINSTSGSDYSDV